jgi:hypothetical protein
MKKKKVIKKYEKEESRHHGAMEKENIRHERTEEKEFRKIIEKKK